MLEIDNTLEIKKKIFSNLLKKIKEEFKKECTFISCTNVSGEYMVLVKVNGETSRISIPQDFVFTDAHIKELRRQVSNLCKRD